MSIGGGHAEDGEIGTDHFAQIAVDALAVLDHLGRVISLPVETRRQHQDILGTVLDAETAALAAVREDLHLAAGNRGGDEAWRSARMTHGELRRMT
jgi:hypothetical protein